MTQSPAPRSRGIFSMLAHPTTLWRFLRDPSAPKAAKVTTALALLYVVFPFDAVPDVAPIIGWLDDLGLTTVAVGFLAQQAASYENRRIAVRPAAPEGAPKP